MEREDAVTRMSKLDGDGVAGLKGQIIRSDSAEEIRLFADAFLSGAASGFQQRQTTLLGTEVLGNARNAGLNGASQVLNTYAQQITDSIRRDGIFVAVPAGHHSGEASVAQASFTQPEKNMITGSAARAQRMLRGSFPSGLTLRKEKMGKSTRAA